MLDAAGRDDRRLLFLIGSRGAQIAASHGIEPAWTGAMPSHTSGVPRFADTIAMALYARIAAGDIDRLAAVFARRAPDTGLTIEKQALLPLDVAVFAGAADAAPPLLNLRPAALLDQLTADYVHARICHAALHAFAAENEARIAAMAAARREIDRQLGRLQRRQRIVRQDEITAEIIELASGEAATGRRR